MAPKGSTKNEPTIDETSNPRLGAALLMRDSYQEELEGRLREAGFAQIVTLGGYDGRKYDGTGEMLFVAQRATGDSHSRAASRPSAAASNPADGAKR